MCYNLNVDIRTVNNTALQYNNWMDGVFSLSPSLDLLNNLKSQLISNTLLTFYTDGSLSNIGNFNARIGLDWIQTNRKAPAFTFNARVMDWQSGSYGNSVRI